VRSAQRGAILILVLIMLGAGAVVLPPSLRYVRTTLNLLRVSQQTTMAHYALDGITQQALAMLQYDTSFKDCNNVSGIPTPDAIVDSFANCVAMWGKWTLATQGKLTGGFNETQVERVNDQEVTVSIEVPGALTAPPEPTPTPTSDVCIFTYGTRDTTWAQAGGIITYEIHAVNCSSSPSMKNLRRLVVLLPSAFDYVSTDYSSSLFSGWSAGANKEPTVARCAGIDNPYPGCEANDNSLILIWPYGNSVFVGGTAVPLAGGQTKVLRFKASPTTWGIFYIDVSVCFFSAGASGCNVEVGNDPLKKEAPVVVGMFNINGNGQGYAFGASSKLDGSGSGLISQVPQ